MQGYCITDLNFLLLHIVNNKPMYMYICNQGRQLQIIQRINSIQIQQYIYRKDLGSMFRETNVV